MFVFYPTNAKREIWRTLLVTPNGNLQAAGTLALDDDLAVSRTQFDLANVAAAAPVFSAIRIARFGQVPALHRETTGSSADESEHSKSFLS